MLRVRNITGANMSIPALMAVAIPRPIQPTQVARCEEYHAVIFVSPVSCRTIMVYLLGLCISGVWGLWDYE